MSSINDNALMQTNSTDIYVIIEFIARHDNEKELERERIN